MGLQAGLSSCPKTKANNEWLRRNVPAFISVEDWPSGSLYLNPRDYKLWAVLEDMAYQKRHNNVDSVKRSLVKPAAEIPLGDGACRESRVAGASQGLRRGRGWPF